MLPRSLQRPVAVTDGSVTRKANTGVRLWTVFAFERRPRGSLCSSLSDATAPSGLLQARIRLSRRFYYCSQSRRQNRIAHLNAIVRNSVVAMSPSLFFKILDEPYCELLRLLCQLGGVTQLL
jgi:hypothetical protein